MADKNTDLPNLEGLLISVAGVLDVVKGEWKEAWSPYDQALREDITKWLMHWHVNGYTRPSPPSAPDAVEAFERLMRLVAHSDMWRGVVDSDIETIRHAISRPEGDAELNLDWRTVSELEMAFINGATEQTHQDYESNPRTVKGIKGVIKYLQTHKHIKVNP